MGFLKVKTFSKSYFIALKVNETIVLKMYFLCHAMKIPKSDHSLKLHPIPAHHFQSNISSQTFSLARTTKTRGCHALRNS